MPDLIPEFVKNLITANPTQYFLALLAFGAIGMTTVTGGLGRRLRGRREPAVPAPGVLSNPDSILKLADTIDSLNQRVAELEAQREFDRQLRQK